MDASDLVGDGRYQKSGPQYLELSRVGKIRAKEMKRSSIPGRLRAEVVRNERTGSDRLQVVVKVLVKMLHTVTEGPGKQRAAFRRSERVAKHLTAFLILSTRRPQKPRDGCPLQDDVLDLVQCGLQRELIRAGTMFREQF